MQVDYQSVGSGSGVKSFIDGTVDFAASDSAMKPDDIAKVDRGVLLLPMTAGSIVLAYNLEGISKLKLSQRVNNCKGNKKDKVEQALKRAALWDEVKDKLHVSALPLSGGQQQRLCIARAIATDPEILLMDESCSALDPIATRRIEELMIEHKQRYTIVIVTHNLQQAQRVADKTGFLYVDTSQGGRTG